MHVSHSRAAWSTAPCVASSRRNQVGDINGIGGHGDRGPIQLPTVARTISIHFNAKAVRITQIDRFAHKMIGHASANAEAANVREKLTK